MSFDDQLTICIDFDGVLHYFTGWLGLDEFSDPVPGASEFTHKLRDAGWKITIYTARGTTPGMLKWLEDNDIIFDAINESPWMTLDDPEFIHDPRKPMAHVYLDDHGITFNGDFNLAFQQVIDFTPWWSRRNKDEDD